MAMRTFDPESAATRFLSYEDIKSRYKRAKRRFYTRKRLYSICRKWPNMTRDAKAKVYESARECRAYQQLKQHLDAKRAAISIG